MSGMFEDVARLREADPASGGGEVPLTAIAPEGHARGGIVVLHESRKFTESLLDLMRALAGEGWIVVAPNLFHRQADGDDAKVFGDNLFADFDACFDWLTARGVFPDCIGALGFDDAGTAAFLVATNRPIGAAVSVAARGITTSLGDGAAPLVEAATSLKAPWLGLYGEDDPETPAADIGALEEAVAHADVATNVVTYVGLTHRADEPKDPGADVDAEDSDNDAIIDAQTRIFDWFDAHLR